MNSVPVLLLHGALGGSDQLLPLAAALQPAFRVHQLDFEGHADSPPADRPNRVEHFVENVLAVLDDEALTKPHIFGYSMGGYVALCLALAYPDRVSSVATLGTKFRWDPATAEREASRLDPPTIRAKVPRFADALAVRHKEAGGWEAVLRRTADFLRHLGSHPDLTDAALARIARPARVIVGDRDNTVSVAECEGVVQALASGSLTVLPDTPHPIEQVSVDALASVLQDFFAAVAAK